MKSEQAAGGRVLVVDDDRFTRELLEELLSRSCDVKTMADPVEALFEFERGYYGVAMIDLDMPGMAGDELAASMKEKNLAVITILITAHRLNLSDPKLNDFDFWIPKPFLDLDHLENTVARAVELHEARSFAIEC